VKVLATEGFVVSSLLAARAKATLEPMETKLAAPRKAAASAGPGHAGLYARLKAWRDAKAKEWEVPAFMILPLKTLEALVAQVPRTMAQLHTIKGLGKKKIAQMGSEILAVIEELEQQEELPPYSGADEPEAKVKSKPAGPNPTSQVSFDLFLGGQSVATIALTRGLAVSTIESHLAQYVSTGELDIGRLVDSEKVRLITDFFATHDTTSMGSAKAALGEAVSFSDLRLVMKHLEFTGKKSGVEQQS
jgi:uncharacterized protein YpbB